MRGTQLITSRLLVSTNNKLKNKLIRQAVAPLSKVLTVSKMEVQIKHMFKLCHRHKLHLPLHQSLSNYT